MNAAPEWIEESWMARPVSTEEIPRLKVCIYHPAGGPWGFISVGCPSTGPVIGYGMVKTCYERVAQLQARLIPAAVLPSEQAFPYLEYRPVTREDINQDRAAGCRFCDGTGTTPSSCGDLMPCPACQLGAPVTPIKPVKPRQGVAVPLSGGLPLFPEFLEDL